MFLKKILIVFILCLLTQTAYAINITYLESYDIHGENPELMLFPYQIALDSSGNLVINDKKPSIRIFDQNGNFISTQDIPFIEEIDKKENIIIAFDSVGDTYFSLENEQKVIKYSKGKVIVEWNAPSISWPQTILLLDDGYLYLADNSSIKLLNPSGEIEASFDNLELWQPMSLALSSEGNLYIADTNNDLIKVINPQGELLNQWGESGVEDHQLINPRAISFDQEENLFVLDSGIHEDFPLSRFKIYNKYGAQLQNISLPSGSKENPSYPVDFILFENRIYLVDMIKQCVDIYQINY